MWLWDKIKYGMNMAYKRPRCGNVRMNPWIQSYKE